MTDAIVLAGPAVEPVTLADAKSFLRLDGTDEDEVVGALVTAARLTVEARGRLALLRQTWRLRFAGWPSCRTVRVPVGPVEAVVAARLVSSAGTATVLPAGACRLHPGGDRLLLVAADAPEPEAGGRIEVDLLCGYGTDPSAVPEPLRLAIRLLVANWFEHRGDEPDGSALPVPPRVGALLATYRRPRLA